MNAFEKALLQAVNDDYSDVPAEEDLNLSPNTLKKVRKVHALRRTLIIAAAIIALAGSAFAAYVISHQLGNVDVETDEYEIFHMSIDDNNRYYQITFDENFAHPDAPDKIQTYFLPTKIADAKNLRAPSCYIEQHDFMSFRPYDYAQIDPEHGTYTPSVIVRNFTTNPSDIERIMSAPTTVHYEWDVNDQFISFSQSLAVIAADGTPFVNHVVQDEDTIIASYRTMQIDEYEVFSFEYDFSKHSGWRNEANAVSRFWYWTDGDYLFSLRTSMPDSEMTELFRSVKPVSEVFPYRLTDENQVAENFTLMN